MCGRPRGALLGAFFDVRYLKKVGEDRRIASGQPEVTASRLRLRTDFDGIEDTQVRLGVLPPPGDGTQAAVWCTPRAMNRRRDSDRIGFRRLASARHPDHEAPLRCNFGCIATRCPPLATVFGS
jgi:hypothetical protein